MIDPTLIRSSSSGPASTSSVSSSGVCRGLRDNTETETFEPAALLQVRLGIWLWSYVREEIFSWKESNHRSFHQRNFLIICIPIPKGFHSEEWGSGMESISKGFSEESLSSGKLLLERVIHHL
ncbi:uncharacterized protein LOC130506508 [Raphanus sativus]|uniref:Uncharacterized protein LOC130506508 n=1 Tax=Raphanus sativus TaxID=3726 RepID=A0A9W3CZU6_RAPSA|nr:uncharacterized protein LOC130506508 [Raphanus sativus]